MVYTFGFLVVLVGWWGLILVVYCLLFWVSAVLFCVLDWCWWFVLFACFVVVVVRCWRFPFMFGIFGSLLYFGYWCVWAVSLGCLWLFDAGCCWALLIVLFSRYFYCCFSLLTCLVVQLDWLVACVFDVLLLWMY